jgi:hypothetical protein
VEQHAFEGIIAGQIQFLRSVQEVRLKNRKLVEVYLCEPPLTVFGRNAVERYLSPHEIRELQLPLAA